MKRPDIEDSLKRVSALCRQDISDAWLDRWVRPEVMLPRLERWLASTTNPATQWSVLIESGPLGEAMLTALEASSPIANLLAQNPEMAGWILDPQVALRQPSRAELLAAGRSYLSAVDSNAFRQDRLRLLQQEWMLRIITNDLSGNWKPVEVWSAISVLAEALLILCLEATWHSYRLDKGLGEDCPLQIATFGKLAGGELNLSSDVDLVFVLPDDASEEDEKLMTRFATLYRRNLEEPMGRGILYRVDLRLRPFGASGPVVIRWQALESYYSRYAEVWEQLALIRSSMLVGDEARWNRLREKVCFESRRGPWQLEQLVKQRAQLESQSHPNDIKRGAGGIRDIEFAVQAMQLMFGHESQALQTRSTLDSLQALEQGQYFAPETAAQLREAYIFLRQLEHRIQLRNDQQTHVLPDDPEIQSDLARWMGFDSVAEFQRALNTHREHARHEYSQVLPVHTVGEESKQIAMQRAGALAGVLQDWVVRLPNADAYWRVLAHNSESIGRVGLALKRAPKILFGLPSTPAIADSLVSGEIVEPASDLPVRFRFLRSWIAWSLDPTDQDPVQSVLFDWLSGLAADLPLGVVALGSLALGDLSLESDLDLVLVSLDGDGAQHARTFIQRLDRERAGGWLGEVDFRLRPEGRKGQLAPTIEAYQHYEETSMEPWERLACGFANVIVGGEELSMLFQRFAHQTPMDGPILDNLLAMKKRVENERVDTINRHRNMKLGPGGLDDSNWLIGLLSWKHPNCRSAPGTSWSDRLLRIESAGLISTEDGALYRAARHHLVRLKRHLALMGLDSELLPENPDRLDALAECFGLDCGNDLIAVHQAHRSAMRDLFERVVVMLQQGEAG